MPKNAKYKTVKKKEKKNGKQSLKTKTYRSEMTKNCFVLIGTNSFQSHVNRFDFSENSLSHFYFCWCCVFIVCGICFNYNKTRNP